MRFPHFAHVAGYNIKVPHGVNDVWHNIQTHITPFGVRLQWRSHIKFSWIGMCILSAVDLDAACVVADDETKDDEQLDPSSAASGDVDASAAASSHNKWGHEMELLADECLAAMCEECEGSTVDCMHQATSDTKQL